ncbi:unnamed protein product [marine sediment metagenome]|uniref:histidine kinase n=1 Tax=marine sediment metagenome TaxID=412755 RepID=X0VSB8_9ZZZZ
MVVEQKKGTEFISATIHELKTSLTAIIAAAELLADELQQGEKSLIGKLIRSIIRNAHSIDEKLPHALEVQRLLTGNLQLKPEPVAIDQVIHNVVALFYPKALKEKQSLTLEVPDSLPLVKADSQRIERALLTLVANASKFTPKGGKIKVSAWQDNNTLVVQVSDTGIGIPPAEQERIFQPYYQIKQGGGKLTGSGLGLAIAKSIVELHGGNIWLKSVVGQGSSFFFSLPLSSSQ